MLNYTYEDEPFYIAVGTSEATDKKVSGEVGVTGGKGAYQKQKGLKWDLYFNPSALPDGFIPVKNLKNWMAGTLSTATGALFADHSNLNYNEVDHNILEKASKSKGKDILEYLLENAEPINTEKKLGKKKVIVLKKEDKDSSK